MAKSAPDAKDDNSDYNIIGLDKLSLYICFILYGISIIILYLPKYDNSYIIALFIILISVITIIILTALDIVKYDSDLDIISSNVPNTNKSDLGPLNNFIKHIGLFIFIIALSWIIYLYSTFDNELNGSLINEYKAFHNSIVFMMLIILFLIIFNRDGCGLDSAIYSLIYIILIFLYVCIGIMQTMLMYYSTDG